MNIIKQTKLKNEQKAQIIMLWNNEYPEKLAYKSRDDFENYLDKLSSVAHYLLVSDAGEVYAWAITFNRDQERWFAIIISEKHHGKGIGTQLLNKLKEDEVLLNSWGIDHAMDKKMNGKPYKTPLEFYLKNGFKVCAETRLESSIISAIKVQWIKT
ncbi:GNAT family N-acetyltransferase [Sphingobacterium sp. MYb382]|uniref:GNAT family N-acetyltransferase n=1 Tax=Sphingobacterium sp. MYb382 TaxID=2745278 RepID=UPI00309DE5AD